MTVLILKGVLPFGGSPRDLAVLNGQLVDSAAVRHATDAQDIDCSGLIVLPGLVDLHTHLREPGQPETETIDSGTLAAARGGFTAVCAMANTNPVADTADAVEHVARLGAAVGNCDVYPTGSVTAGLAGQHLADIAGMARSAAAVRMFSDDGNCIANSSVMRAGLLAVRSAGGVLAQHAQDPLLTVGAQLNDGAVSRILGWPGWPAVAEEAIIARDCLLAHHLQARLHICHVSTKGSVEVLRWAKTQGWPVTAEVTPHHLLLTDEMARTGNPVYKVNPPLRTAEDVEALRTALVDGTIDAVATDHAPDTPQDKARPWCEAPMGMLGLETALAIVADTFVASGRMSWNTLAERMSTRPAAIAGHSSDHGSRLTPGSAATLCLVDPSHSWSVDADQLASRSNNTPFAGHTFTTRVIATLLRGSITHDLLGLFE